MLIVLGLGLILGFRVLVDFIRSWCIMAAGARLTLQWKMSLFRHLLRLPLSFFERRHVGDLASRFGSLDAIQKTLTTGPISGLVDGLMSVALIAMMWLYEPLLAMLAVGVMVIYAADAQPRLPILSPGQRRGDRYRRAGELAFRRNAARHAEHQGAGHRRPPAGQHGTTISSTRSAPELRVQRLDMVFRTVNAVLFGLDRIVIIFFGARAVMSGSLTVGMLVAFLAYKDQFSQRVATFLDTIVRIGMLAVHGERIADIALAEPEEPPGAGPAIVGPSWPDRRASSL